MSGISQSESTETPGNLALASAQKLLLWAILTSIVGWVLWWLQLIVIPFQLYCVFRLARALGMSKVTALFYLVAMFIPLLNLICLLVLNGKATRTLRAAGIQVGFMGAKTSSTQMHIGFRICVVLVVLVVAGAVIHDISILTGHPITTREYLTSIYRVLQAPKRLRITGVVRDPEGQPVPGASITLLAGRQQPVKSDAQGTFEATWDLHPTGSAGALMLLARHTSRNLAAAVEIDAKTSYPIEVKLQPGVTVTGAVVLQPHGKPIAGVAVGFKLLAAYWTPLGRGIRTDPAGRYEIKALPPGQRLWISARAVDFDSTLVAIEVNLAEAADGRFEVPTLPLRAYLSLAGTVVNKDTGKPVVGAFVQISGQGQPSRPYIETGADGKFRFDKLYEGTVQLTARAADFGRTHVEVNLSEAADGRVEAPPIVLKVANLSLAGTVVNKDTGKPVVGAFVRISGQGQPYHHRLGIKTDADGKFRFDKLCEGNVQLSASATDFIPTKVQIELDAAGDRHVAVPPILLAPILKITGVVRDPEGQPD